jgi:copper chaperone NosL
MNTPSKRALRPAWAGQSRLRGPFAMAATCAILVLAACAGAPSGDDQPPKIEYGYDLCEACGMLIDDPRHAAATVTLDGTAHKFDDIGDMVRYHAEHPTEQARAWFVHDFDTEAWLRAEAAWFVFGPEVNTPMGHGIAAFADEASAAALAQAVGAEVFSFDEARAALAAMDHSHH